MSTVFYLYGILYVLYYSKALYDSFTFDFKKDVSDKMDEMLPNKITRENANATKNNLIENFKKGIWEIIAESVTGILNWVWIIAGALYATEATLFGILTIFSILSLMMMLFYSVKLVLKNREKIFNVSAENPKSGFMSVAQKAPANQWLIAIDRSIRLGISISILYIHFFNA